MRARLAILLLAAASARAAPDDAGRAVALLESGRAAEAESVAARRVAQAPDDGPAWNALGLARHAQSRFADAEAAFARAAKLLPRDARVLANLGAARFESARFDPAREALDAAARLDAAYAKPHLYLGRIAVAQADARTAEKELALATTLDPAEAAAWYHLGLFLFQQRRHAEAVAAFERCLAISPSLASAHLNIGLALRRLGQEERAREHLETFRKLSDAVARDTEVQLRTTRALQDAQQAMADGNLATALERAGEAAALAPDATAPHAMLADIHARMGHAQDAERERALCRPR